MRWLILLLCACAHRIPKLDGTAIEPSQIDAIVNRELHAHAVTGASVTVFAHGVPVFARAYGNLTQDSVVEAASLTKPAFAYTVMTLVDEHVIDLDRPIYLDLPDPPDPYRAVVDDPRWKQLTPRILLSHTSGFANFARFEDDGVLRFHFTPGTRYAYSGQGLELLQVVIEHVTGKPLGELMQARLFERFGMARTSMTWRPDLGDSIGYDEHGQPLPPRHRKRADAAGSLLTTPTDYAKFLSAMLRGAHPDMLVPQIQITSAHEFPTLDPATTDENRKIELAYGLCWGVYKTPFGRAFFKGGHDDGWRHYFVGFANGSGLLVMTNSSNGEAIYQALLEQVLGNPYTPIAWQGWR
ncbi:MAG TPA: serine hydrolase domain-containing protein [Kofleriaceae bacterium]